MNDFFKTIYDHAVETDQLTHENNRQFRDADFHLRQLLESLHLDTATQTKLLDAAFGLLYVANIEVLGYGFRLALQVIGPIVPVYPAHA